MNLDTIKSICQPEKASKPSGRSIVIGNSYCTLQGFDLAATAAVRAALTYDNQEVIQEIQSLKVSISRAVRFKKFQRIGWMKSKIAQLEGNIKVCWLRGDRFPTGHLVLIKGALDTARVSYNVVDARQNTAKKIPLAWASKPLEPRYFQKAMLELGLSQHRGVFESAVGTGKTYIMQLLVHHIGVPTLIICPSKDLAVQTYDSFVQAFGESKVELVSTAKAGHRKAIRVCTIQTLSAFLKKGCLELLLKAVGMVCIDEVHHAGAKSYADLLPYFDHIYFRFGFSGTFMRNDSKTLDMWGFLSTVLYRYSAGQATREGFLTPLKILTHEIDGQKGGTYQTEYTRNYCDNPELLICLKKILEDISKDEQVLILVGRKEKSGHIIKDYLDELGIPAEYVSGDSKREHVRQALEGFNAKAFQVLVGSTIIGEGIDVRSTDHLIMAQGGKSEIAVTQAVGRAVRLYKGKEVAFLHDFRFAGTKYLEKHLERRLEIYQKNFDGEILC